jgi:hypothetical protein
MGYFRPKMTIKAIVGKKNGGPLRPYVEVENIESWLSPSQARAVASRLMTQATRAENQHRRNKAQALTSDPEPTT